MLKSNFEHSSGDELLISPQFCCKEGKLQLTIQIVEEHGVRIHLIHPLFTANSHFKIDGLIGPLPVIPIRAEPLLRTDAKVSKRLLDILISGTFFLIGFWRIYLIVGMIIKLTSPSPVLFKQERIGGKRKKFLCYKF